MRLRFSIRDLLWLAAFVALAVGWWLDHGRLAPDAEEWEYAQELIDGLSRSSKGNLEKWQAAQKRIEKMKADARYYVPDPRLLDP